MCTSLITALNTVASYVTPSNVLGDLSGQIAALNPVPGTLTELSLTVGGNAAIVVPSATIDGKIIKILVAGYYTGYSAASSSLNIQIGTSQLFSVTFSSIAQNFYIEIDCLWTSIDDILRGMYSTYGGSGGVLLNSLSPSLGNFTFFLNAQDVNNTSDTSVNVTQFKIELI